MKIIREACVENLQESVSAYKKGAERLELCDNLACGGTSNAYGVLKSVLKAVDIPVMCMVRPRGGDFVYTAAEFESMIDDAKICRSLDAYGVVSGILLPDGNVDVERTKILIDCCGNMPFTFHKAFDLCPNPEKALEDIIACGAQRLLTSGQQLTAQDGMDMLNRLHKQANGRIKIVAAGKVTNNNLRQEKLPTIICLNCKPKR